MRREESVLSSMARRFAAKVTGAGAAARQAQVSERGEPQVGPSAMDELRKLAEFRDAGIVTQEEFERTKARLLGD